MSSKLRSTYGDDALNRATEGFTAPAPPSSGRLAARPTPAVAREKSGISHKPLPALHARADFDPSSSREALIATAAYYRAERRGFAPGHELDDWIAAEREVDAVGSNGL